MSQRLVIELTTKRIMVNNLLPGWIAPGTQIPDEAFATWNTQKKRVGTPGAVAELIDYPASDEAPA
jgi:3-oxoacyl-[acyl-carrier protein] reductase